MQLDTNLTGFSMQTRVQPKKYMQLVAYMVNLDFTVFLQIVL